MLVALATPYTAILEEKAEKYFSRAGDGGWWGGNVKESIFTLTKRGRRK